MKREIKFRGKSYVNGLFYYGNLDVFRDGRTKIYVWREDSYQAHQSDVDPETVGQYTGLKDKNGKDIYEGDIITYTDVFGVIRYNEVLFNNGSFGINIFGKDWSEFVTMDGLLNEADFYLIGNIHDNPELLEGKK